MKLKMDGICKSFGSNEVLKSVGFQLSEGEICALLGENGAGKSTLMNILGGVLQPDSGEILLDGQKRKFDSPAQSLDAGIAFIHQELNLINDLPIYENMFIGRELKKKNGQRFGRSSFIPIPVPRYISSGNLPEISVSRIPCIVPCPESNNRE